MFSSPKDQFLQVILGCRMSAATPGSAVPPPKVHVAANTGCGEYAPGVRTSPHTFSSLMSWGAGCSLLARLHKIMVDKAQLEDRLRALSGPGAATKPASTPPPANSVPKKTS